VRATFLVRVESVLRASPAAVWAHASSMAGVNEELWPVRMSHPPGARLDASVPLGVPLLRSVVTLGGVVPIDVHELRLLSFDEGRAFHEDSRTLVERRWQHRRTIDPSGEGTRVVDEVTFSPRLFGVIVAPIVRAVFARRHGVLRARFGDASAGPVVATLARA
jgi:ligand-binding SRPBCC domain-containing protein